MQNSQKVFRRAIVVGAGPVGSFVSVLFAYLGIPVTCYEKRPEFSRNTKLRITRGFFREVQGILDELGIDRRFFEEMDDYMRRCDNKIVVRELERKLREEALSTGKFECRTEEVRSFAEMYERHSGDDPIILDCAGRNSSLRINEFGDDSSNVITTPLQHAIYINFKAKNTKPVVLYPVIKNIKDMVLINMTVGDNRAHDATEDVTIPVFISERLASVFDQSYPRTNRRPFNPFNTPCSVPDEVLYSVSSIIGTLMAEGWDVDLSSVMVKKIEINCGYAKQRSRDRYVCLGDSAVHLAFFRSLNLGLKHALEFFVSLSTYCGKPDAKLDRRQVMVRFKQDNPHLNPISVHETSGGNSYLVVTKVVSYGCFHYCLTNHRTERLTSFLGTHHAQVSSELAKLNVRLSDWESVLDEFETRRARDIEKEIGSNLRRNTMYEYISWIVDINGSSPIKISELVSEVIKGYSLGPKDYDFFFRCFKVFRHRHTPDTDADGTIRLILEVISEYKELHKETTWIVQFGRINITKDAIFGNVSKRNKLFVHCVTTVCEDSGLDAKEKLYKIRMLLDEYRHSKGDVELGFVKKLICSAILLCERRALEIER